MDLRLSSILFSPVPLRFILLCVVFVKCYEQKTLHSSPPRADHHRYRADWSFYTQKLPLTSRSVEVRGSLAICSSTQTFLMHMSRDAAHIHICISSSESQLYSPCFSCHYHGIISRKRVAGNKVNYCVLSSSCWTFK